MDKRFVLHAYASILLLSCVGINLQFVKPARASTTWTVDDDGPADFASIQEAINAASDWDTIYVYNGTYWGNVVVNKTVSLIGENQDITIIDGSGTQAVLKIVNHNINVTGFTVQNGAEGIYVEIGADSCIIGNCKIVNNNIGIFVESDYNLLTKNMIVNNSESAVKIFADCGCSPVQRNIVIENRLSNNNFGIYLKNSEGTMIYHNDFQNNIHQFYLVGFLSYWDNGTEGNYWSDYAGIDANGDGIGDIPLVIEVHNQDNYPLMSPYRYWCDPIPGDANKDTKVDYKDLFLLALRYGSGTGDSNADLNNDGKVDYKDLFILAANYGKKGSYP